MLKWLQKHVIANSPLEAQLFPRMKTDVMFRSYSPADLDVCRDIYQRNESAHFPRGELPGFESYLQSEATVIVAECNGHVVGVGGIRLVDVHVALLGYGIIAPEYQGRRIGTTLALLRIAQLAPLNRGCLVMMSALQSSLPFYRRFGFGEFSQWKDQDELDHPVAVVHVPAYSARWIRMVLHRRGIRVHGTIVLHAPPTAPAQPAA